MTNERAPMSFREKSAWMFMAFFLVIFVLYFWNVVAVLAGRHGLGEPILDVTVLLVALVIAHWALARWSREDARAPKDEREWLIELQSSRLAFFALLTAGFLSNGMLHVHGAGKWAMAQCIMAAIALAEIVNFGSRIVYYRRDA